MKNSKKSQINDERKPVICFHAQEKQMNSDTRFNSVLERLNLVVGINLDAKPIRPIPTGIAIIGNPLGLVRELSDKVIIEYGPGAELEAWLPIVRAVSDFEFVEFRMSHVIRGTIVQLLKDKST